MPKLSAELCFGRIRRSFAGVLDDQKIMVLILCYVQN